MQPTSQSQHISMHLLCAKTDISVPVTIAEKVFCTEREGLTLAHRVWNLPHVILFLDFSSLYSSVDRSIQLCCPERNLYFSDYTLWLAVWKTWLDKVMIWEGVPGTLPFPLPFEKPCKNAIAPSYLIKPGVLPFQKECQDSSNPWYPLTNNSSQIVRGKVDLRVEKYPSKSKIRK